MKQYYLHDGQNQIGPFSTEELKDKSITRDTYVWKEGMTDWVKADEVAALNEVFGITPPPFKAATAPNIAPPPMASRQKIDSGTVKTGMWIGRNPKLSVLLLVLLVLAGYGIFRTQHSGSPYSSDSVFDSIVREKTPEELRQELREKEKRNPQQYLIGSLTMRGNLLGEKVIEGTIANSASTTTFKDIVVEVSFLSKTHAVIRTDKFTVYDVVGPQQTITIKKYKTFAPNDTEAFSVGVVDALPVE